MKLFFTWAVLVLIAAPNLTHAVDSKSRPVLARARQNQINIHAFPYKTFLSKIGAKDVLEVDRIRFMSDTAENEFSTRKSPPYPTVLALVEVLKADPSLLQRIPPVLVWQDTSDRIFTIDHRRLIAAKLAGIGQIPAQWATPEEIRQEHFKFTTKNLGRSIDLIDENHHVIQTIEAAAKVDPDEALIDRALQFAIEAHKGQRYGEHPYSYHLTAVASILRRFGYTQSKYLVAALLHDSIEDTKTTYDDILGSFGKEVADIVWAVTSGEGKTDAEQWENTYPKIQASFDAQIVKLADRIANTEESIYGPTQGRLGKLKSYQKKWEEFAKLRAAGPLDGIWNYLERLTWNQDFARTQLPSAHQEACEVALVAYPDLIDRFRKRE